MAKISSTNSKTLEWVKGTNHIIGPIVHLVCKIAYYKYVDFKRKKEEGKKTVYLKIRPSQIYGHPNIRGEYTTADYIGGLIPKNDITVLIGPTGAGKSILLTQILLCASSGRDSIFDITSEPTSRGIKSILYDAENGRTRFESRYNPKDNYTPVEVIHKEHCHFSDVDEFIKELKMRILECSSDCIVGIDNITRIFPHFYDAEIARFYSGLEGIQSSMNASGKCVTFIIVSHTNEERPIEKGIRVRDIRGSGNIGNFASRILAINNTPQKGCIKFINAPKDRDGNLTPENGFLVEILDTPFCYMKLIKEISEVVALERRNSDNATHKDSIGMKRITPSMEEQIHAYKVGGSSREAARLLRAEGHKVSHTTIATTVKKYSQEK